MTRSLGTLLLLLAAALVGCKQSRPVPALVQQLSDPAVARRVAAADALAALGSKAAPAVPALIKALDDKAARVKRHAAAALGKIGPKALPAFPALVGLQGIDEATAALCAIAATVKPAAFVDAIWRYTSSKGAMTEKVQGIMAMRKMAAGCPETVKAMHPLIQQRAQQALDEKIELPLAAETVKHAPTIVIALPGGDPDRGTITLDGVLVGTVKQALQSDDPDWKLPKLVSLLEQKKRAWKQANPGQTFEGNVIVKVDQKVEFKVIKKVMYSCGLAGYSKVHVATTPDKEPA